MTVDSLTRSQSMITGAGKAFICFVVFWLIFIWIYNLKNGWDEYKPIIQVLEEPQYQLEDTENEWKSLNDNLRPSCYLWDPNLPVIYGITPTYTRLVQEAELTRCMYGTLEPKNRVSPKTKV